MKYRNLIIVCVYVCVKSKTEFYRKIFPQSKFWRRRGRRLRRPARNTMTAGKLHGNVLYIRRGEHCSPAVILNIFPIISAQ